jgi:hypothetical protein
MKKHLHTESVENELRGASLFFRKAPEEPSPELPPAREPGEEPSPPSEDDRPSGRDAGPPSLRTGGRRMLTRVPFEFYLDQVERLRRISLHAKLRGEKGSMSEMMRDALDRYLAQLPDPEGAKPIGRTGVRLIGPSVRPDARV